MPPQEKWVAFALIPLIVLPPWFLGGMRWWQQIVYWVLSVIPFILCFVPFRDTDAPENKKKRRVVFRDRSFQAQAVRLLKFPVFWLGLLFVLYCAVGAWNHAFVHRSVIGGRWVMQPQAPDTVIAWLPNGIDAPFRQMNGWRVVIIYTTGLLLACTLWLGVERRRTLWLLLGVFGFNAFLVALLTIIQSLSGTGLIYWSFESANPHFAGPFQYRNHGAAYMYLGLAACIACGLHYWKRGPADGHKSSAAPLFLFFAIIIVGGLVFANSRGGIVFGTGVLLAAGLLFLISCLHSGKQGLVAFGAVVLSLCIAGYFAKPYLDRAWPQLEQRWKATERQIEALRDNPINFDSRILNTRATLDMWQAKPWLGWGAGSYRWMFKQFQFQYPDLYYFPWSLYLAERNPDRHQPVHQTFFNTHNDWAQFLAEYGILGTALLLLCVGYWVMKVLFNVAAWSAAIWVLLAGDAMLLLHGLIDFPFYNPPVFLAFVTILAAVGTLASGQRTAHR